VSRLDAVTEPALRLPPGERVLWQGAPRWQTLARRMFRLRGLSLYFAVLLVWYATTVFGGNRPAWGASVATARLALLAVAAVGLLALYAWLASRATRYIVTNRRIVLRLGVALPMTINLPFSRVEQASLKAWPDGTGDIALSLVPGERVPYVLLWPHVRPWRMARAEPMLRAIPGAAEAAHILARALAASACVPVPAAPGTEPRAATHGGPQTAAA
jgi:hypothetical protein